VVERELAARPFVGEVVAFTLGATEAGETSAVGEFVDVVAATAAGKATVRTAADGLVGGVALEAAGKAAVITGAVTSAGGFAEVVKADTAATGIAVSTVGSAVSADSANVFVITSTGEIVAGAIGAGVSLFNGNTGTTDVFVAALDDVLSVVLLILPTAACCVEYKGAAAGTTAAEVSFPVAALVAVASVSTGAIIIADVTTGRVARVGERTAEAAASVDFVVSEAVLPIDFDCVSALCLLSCI
jgi:hypothetical protein